MLDHSMVREAALIKLTKTDLIKGYQIYQSECSRMKNWYTAA